MDFEEKQAALRLQDGQKEKELLLCVIEKGRGKKGEENSLQIRCAKGSRLSMILREHGIFLPSYCGGKGSCKKCRVQVLEGFLPVTPEDGQAFSEESLEKGMRLSCRAVLREPLTIAVEQQSETMFAAPKNSRKTIKGEMADGDNACGIAIDIGTTTLAFSLLELQGGKIACTHTAANSQRIFGADVISRIEAACAKQASQMQKCIKQDLLEGIQILLRKGERQAGCLKALAIAGNTVMLHLLQGYSCQGFCRYPFAPESLEAEQASFFQMFGACSLEGLPEQAGDIPVFLLPSVSAFLGADVTAGLYACRVMEEKKTTFFLDIGTNGEMALKTGEKILAASAAAGPAFEGGSIQWGMPGILGAISSVWIRNGLTKVWTIGNGMPEGICGTGVMEAAAELFRAGIMDKGGKLKEPYFSEGYPLAVNGRGEGILFFQKDIRKLQMAKSAIRAGIEVLLQQAGISCQDVEQVYLAGSFGYYLNLKKTAPIGILPREWIAKTKAAGNASLQGAVEFLKNRDMDVLQQIAGNADEVQLADHPLFQQLYLKYMDFGI